MWVKVIVKETEAEFSVEPKGEYVGQRGVFEVRLGSNIRADLTYLQARDLFLSLQEALTIGVEE